AFLLGDAAHMMPPFGGQGLNSGLRDIHNLAWKVAMILQNRAAPQLLATYHEERAGHAARMVTFASLIGSLFMSKSRTLVYCRSQKFLPRKASASCSMRCWARVLRCYGAILVQKKRLRVWRAASGRIWERASCVSRPMMCPVRAI